MDYYNQLKDTVLGATSPQYGAPAPLLTNSDVNQKANDIYFQAPLSNAGIGAMASQTDTQIQNQKIAESNAKRAAAQKEDYKRVKKEDGGFAFFDGDGNEVSAYEFANAIGKTPAEVLSDSENPVDSQYIEDYNNLQDYYHAWYNNDEETKNAFLEANPELSNYTDPSQLLKDFKSKYPSVYAPTVNDRRAAGQPTGNTWVPNLGVIQQNINSGADVGA